MEKCLVIPAGKDSTISPVIFTTHLGHQVEEKAKKSHRSLERLWLFGVRQQRNVSLLAGIGAFEIGIDGFREGRCHW